MALDIEAVKGELEELRTRLEGEDERLGHSLSVTLEEESGEESSDQHMADVASVTHDREMVASMRDNTRRLLTQVLHALEKIDAGTYGSCDRCGKPIEEDRLKAVPYATLCMEHQRELERSG